MKFTILILATLATFSMALPADTGLKINPAKDGSAAAIFQIPPQFVTMTSIPGPRAGLPQNPIGTAQCTFDLTTNILLLSCIGRYKLFRAGIFESGFIDLQTDTRHYMRYHHIRGQYERINRAFSYHLVMSVIRIMAKDPGDVVSLTVCLCETNNPRRFELLEELQRFTKLKELIFARVAPEEFVDGLPEAPLPFSVTAGFAAMRETHNRSPAHLMWRLMLEILELKEFLKKFAEGHPAFVIPHIRCVVVTDGKVAWEQLFDEHARLSASLLRELISG
ncbi:hypothetical protein BKA61DRAFT_567674 [Leptodontidium sp. MPI-SDFR-AT-0119]|nr:hypothetical protein BKA61DRAFT_567674 [Leptodontidium sp. MPI-SDFR-AT-0119]